MRPERVRPILLASAIATIVAIVAACSGTAATAPSTASPSAAAASLAPATEAPSSAAPTETPTQAPTEAPSSAAPTVATTSAASETPLPTVGQIADITASLSHLTSYMEEFKQTGGTTDINATVVIVRSPQLQEELDSVGKKTTRMIIVGTDDWFDNGTGTFVKNLLPVKVAQSTMDVFDPGVFLASFNKVANFQLVPVVGVETKNGVQATHLHADETTNLGPGKPTIPPGATFDVWVSTDNDYLVALEYTGLKEGDKVITGSIELTHINDPTLTVKAPS